MSEELRESICDLQTRSAYQEATIQELSDVIYRQQQQIDTLEKQIELLRHVLEKQHDGEGDNLNTEERPPHY